MTGIAGELKGNVLQLDPSMKMYGDDHLPYLIVSLSLVFILVVCPGLPISIYPTRLNGKLIHSVWVLGSNWQSKYLLKLSTVD